MPRPRLFFAAQLLALTTTLLTASSAPADDRQLITGFQDIPNVLILFDTSGSMHWSPRCSQEDFDAGLCDFLCPTGDCYVAANSDSPASKFYQAKAGLYEVLEQVEDIHLGLAAYNQDELHMRSKHWLYAALEEGVSIPGYGPYPAIGSQDVFGREWNCDNGGGDAEIGCRSSDAASLDDSWDVMRVQMLPKASADQEGGVGIRTFYVMDGAGTAFRIQYWHYSTGGSMGDETISVTVFLWQCDAPGSCGSDDRTFLEGKEIDFELITDFNAWDFQVNRTNPRMGFFPQGLARDSPTVNTCAGWDPNDDTSADEIFGYSTRFPTTTDPNYSPTMDFGDVIAIDWRDDHREDLLNRLAPNRLLSETEPDFRTARYFEDDDTPVDLLRLKDENARPLVSFGATPLGAAMADVHRWFDDWKVLADEEDPSFACRSTYLIVLTDGDETCGGDPCDFGNGTGAIFDDYGIRTFVVAFGVEDTPGNQLQCMADNGGTGVDADINGDGEPDGPGPIFPQNKQELVDALTRIFAQIQPETLAFAAAAVPSVQAEALDKLYLTEFVPVPDQSIWPGRMNGFAKPLPLDEDNRPDSSEHCDGPNDSACLVWEAGEIILDTQVRGSEGDPVGDAANQRRVYYSQFRVGEGAPRERLFLEPTIKGSTPLDVEFDLWRGMNLEFVEEICDPIDPLCDPAADEQTQDDARAAANAAIDYVLSEKTATIEDNQTLDYILGDIFHSDPDVVGAPSNKQYFFGDDPSLPNGTTGYREFAQLHRNRRKMLFFGSNDGQVHSLDAGVCRDSPTPPEPLECVFDNGSGKELFSYSPRSVLPTLVEFAEDATKGAPRHQYTVDGRVIAADVRIDPIHAGPRSLADPPKDDDREWRTVLLGGLRRGGEPLVEGAGDLDGPFGTAAQVAAGYYALDITQPDPVNANDPQAVPEATGDDPPACLAVEDVTNPPLDCGTLAFAAPLWEFTDTIQGVRLDEDANDYIDMGTTWSTPRMGRILVCTGACGDPVGQTLEPRFVAFVGGGADPEGLDARGNWLYMIDMETGEALYKRPLLGSAPAEPAPVDTDFDGFIDTVYVGTTLGFLYRVDLQPTILGSVKYPEILPTLVTATAADGTPVTETRDRIVDLDFEPQVLFNGNDGTIDDVVLGTVPAHPVFFRPSVIFIADLDLYAIAFGTGYRQDLFLRDQPPGRYFVFVDDVTFDELQDPAFQLTKDFLEPIDVAGANLDPNENFLQTRALGKNGWFFVLNPDERVATETFALSGVLIFSTFTPDPEPVGEGSLCRENGGSRIFSVVASNGNGLLFTPGGSTADRFLAVSATLAAPFSQQTQTANPPPGIDGGGGGGEPPPPAPSCQGSFDKARAREEIKGLLPENCSFVAGYGYEIDFITVDTGLECPVEIPLCTIEKLFKSFQ